jgi:hypothetical protein
MTSFHLPPMTFNAAPTEDSLRLHAFQITATAQNSGYLLILSYAINWFTSAMNTQGAHNDNSVMRVLSMRRAAILKSPAKVSALNVCRGDVEGYSDAFVGVAAVVSDEHFLTRPKLFRNPVFNEMIILAEFRIDDAVHISGKAAGARFGWRDIGHAYTTTFRARRGRCWSPNSFLINMGQFRDYLSPIKLREITRSSPDLENTIKL